MVRSRGGGGLTQQTEYRGAWARYRWGMETVHIVGGENPLDEDCVVAEGVGVIDHEIVRRMYLTPKT
jgi:hypothetical protein